MDEKKIKIHHKYLKLALEQAKKGRGLCFPNPCVGAIAVQNDEIVGAAYHHGAGNDHAEALLLKELAPGLKNIELYVTLEPCNHWGRTPPCVNAIINYKVQKVVFACYDPHKHIETNDTTQILQSHGIEVEYCQVPEIDAFYQSYHHWVKTKTPFVTAKWAQSLNAKVGYHHQRIQLTNDTANLFTHQQRLQTDMILTTANTILCDHPQFNVRLNGIDRGKPLAILDSKLRLTGQERCFSKATEIHIFHRNDMLPRFFMDKVHYHSMDSGSPLDLEKVMSVIGRLGVHDLWVEAGPQLMASLHDEKRVHKTHILMTPTLLKNDALDAFSMKTPIFEQPYQLQFQPMDDNMLTTFLWQEI